MRNIPGFFLFSLLFLLGTSTAFAQCTAGITSSVNPAKGCSPFTLQLTDASAGVVSNRIWDFGDGSPTSGVQNPIHTFTKASGNDTTYVVTLKTYCLGGDSSVATLTVTVNSPPAVDFVANKTSICALSDTVCFTNNSEAGTGYTYNWNFGDNTSSSQFSPCKVYSNDSTYDITLTVIDSNGCQASLTKPNYVTVKKAPNPDFSVSPQIGCNPLNVTFTNTTNTTVDTIASWLWDFGDGASSGAQSPGVHTYTLAPDTPVVRLTATNNLGCTNYTTKVLVIKPTPTATFTLSSQVCVGDSAEATFTGTAGTSANYNWSFDGGTVNSGAGAGPYSISWPSPGIKTVTLTVDDNGCLDTYMQSILVLGQPTVSLSSSAINDSICDGTPVQFTASPSNYINYNFFLNSVSVQFSGANTYTNPTVNDNDTVRVVVTDINGCTSEPSDSVVIHVKPVPTITVTLNSANTICDGDTTMITVLPAGLNGGYNFFNGFSVVQSGASNVLNYQSSSSHTITVVGTQNGCPSAASAPITVTVTPKLPPATLNCSTSTDTTISFVWDSVALATGYEVSIDGGAYVTPSSGSTGLTHLLAGLSAGDSATLSLRVLGPSPCNDSIVSTVKCYAENCTGIDYSLTGPSSICGTDSIIVDALNVSPSSYNISWNGGGASTSTRFGLVSPSDTTITAVVTNTLEPTCPAVTKSISVSVTPYPVVTITDDVPNDSICKGQPVNITASPGTYGNYAFYINLGLAQSSANPAYSYSSFDDGDSIYVIATENGCVGEASNKIEYTVIDPLDLPQVNCGTSTDTTISFVWGSVVGATGYEVSINGAPYTVPSSGSLGLSHLLNGQTPGAYATIELRALGNLPCGNSVVSFAKTCYAKPCSGITFDYTSNVDLCDGDSTTLSISNINVTNYDVSWVGGPWGADTTYGLTPTTTTVIAVNVRNNDESGCPPATHYTNVNVKQIPSVTLSTSALNDSSCMFSPITFIANPQLYDNYTFFDNYAQVQNGANPNYTTSGFQNGHTVMVIVEEKGCSDTSLNTVSPAIIAPLATPKVNCGTTTNNTISFTWDSIARATGYEVSVNGNPYVTPSSGATGLSHTINGFSPGDSISILVVALGPTPCGSSQASPPRTCYAMPCDGITFTLSGTDSICEGESVILNVSNVNPTTYDLSWNGGAGGAPSSFTVTPATSTSVTAVVTNTAQPTCPSASKYLPINVTIIPTATLSLAGNDSICTGEQLNLTANPPTYDNYEFFNSGASVQNSGNPTYLNSSLTGTNTFSVVTTFYGCKDTSSTIDVTIMPPVSASYSSNAINDSICQGALYSLSVTPSSLDRYVFNVNGSLSQDSPSNIFADSTMPAGNNQVVVRVYDYLGCTNLPDDTVNITMLPYTAVSLSANAVDTICEHQQVKFTATPGGLDQYSFYINDSLVQSGTADTILLSTLGQGDTVTVRSTNALGCESIASAGISFNVKPTANPTVSGDTVGYCLTSGGTASIGASVDSIFNPVSYTWSNGANTASTTVSPTASTYYTVYTTYNGCTSLLDSVFVQVDDQPLPTVNATPTQTVICLGDSIEVQGTGSALRFEWLDANNTVLGTAANVFVTPDSNQTYTYRAWNLACYADATINIDIDLCLEELSGPIPQVITPNGDNANETWILPDIDYFTGNRVSIYNRWGQQIFDMSDYDNSWRGQNMSGQDLPDGTYYYVILLGEKSDKKYTGFVIIHR